MSYHISRGVMNVMPCDVYPHVHHDMVYAIYHISGHVHTHTLYWYQRPFGCSILVATYDTDGPALYKIEPNGNSFVPQHHTPTT